MAKVLMGKTRPMDNPWLVIESHGWKWMVLKAYAKDPNKQYARWMCAVSSPYTFGGVDMGDTYISDIEGRVTHVDQELLAQVAEVLPKHLSAEGA